jgi:hypothetical protein
MELAIIVCNTENASMDYYMPLAKAKELFDQGLMEQVSCYKEHWCYYDPKHQHRRFAVKLSKGDTVRTAIAPPQNFVKFGSFN